MKLSELKTILPAIENVAFQLENGTNAPEHFHITEIGMVTKKIIDCGGTVREERTVNLQLWNANDFDHKLKPSKLLNIIQISEEKLNIKDAEIEVEYQSETIGKYDLDFNGNNFVLVNKQTACLASDKCRTAKKEQINLSELKTAEIVCCTPNSGCC